MNTYVTKKNYNGMRRVVQNLKSIDFIGISDRMLEKAQKQAITGAKWHLQQTIKI